MMRYDDIRGSKRFALLTPVTGSAMAKLRADHPELPNDYEEFLREVGAGEVGSASFMLYDGLVAARSIHGDSGVEHVWLFGDDFQGFTFGFDPRQGWKVVEVDSTNGSARVVADSFEAFARKKLARVKPLGSMG
jgi:hypothetical protein